MLPPRDLGGEDVGLTRDVFSRLMALCLGGGMTLLER